MRSTIIWLVCVVLSIGGIKAQADSVAFTVDSQMSDGVYLNYVNFRYNMAITKEQIKSAADLEQLNFLEKTLQQEKFSYTLNDQAYTLDPKTVWGFFQNNTLYVNYNGEFYRVPVFGSISYLVATVLVRNPMMASPGFGYGYGVSTGTGYSREVHEFLIDFYDGRMIDLSMEKAEALLSRDKTLYDEFMALSRRKRKDELYKYIRRYNGLHPVYFLK